MNHLQIRQGRSLDYSAKDVISSMFNTRKGLTLNKDGSFIYSPEALRSSAKTNRDGFKSEMERIGAEFRDSVKNSNSYAEPLGAYEKMMTGILEPKKIPFGVEYTYQNNALKESDVTIEDIIKPHTDLKIQGLMEQFKASMFDYSNFNLTVQSGTNPNVYDKRNAQPEFGAVKYEYLPVVSYAATFDRSKNEEALISAHNFLGNSIQVSFLYNKWVELFEEQYQYDMVRTSDTLLKGCTLLDQPNEAARTDLGIPNNVDGLADETLTMSQLYTILLKIVAIVNNKNASIRGGISNKINEFIMPLANAVVLKNNLAIKIDDPLTNFGAQNNYLTNRLEFVVNFFAKNGIRVVASNQLNPSSNVGVYDSAIKNSMNPSNAIKEKNRNTVDRPFYLLTNDNSGSDQGILFAPKMSYFSTGFFNKDPLGQIQTTGKIDLFSGIKYMRPEFNRALITTTP